MNADTETQDGGTDTSQCITYKPENSGDGKIGTDDCDHECHAGATQDASSGANKPNHFEE